MLIGYPGRKVLGVGSDSAEGLLWLDLLDPSSEEADWVKRATGIEVDVARGKHRLSSRKIDDSFYLSITSFSKDQDHSGTPSPLALILTPKLLVSLRFSDSKIFHEALEEAEKIGSASSSSTLVAFLDALVDRASTHMHEVAEEIADIAHRTFCEESLHTGDLRDALLEVGRVERRLTQMQSSMLGVARVVTFLLDSQPDWIGEKDVLRLKDLRRDLDVLDEFDDQLDDKLQFLLDAVLGFINTNQNDVVRVLTVVTVVTIPPMILAGIWGMNFKYMPELNWPYGYAMAWGAILLSMLLPLGYFKFRRWI